MSIRLIHAAALAVTLLSETSGMAVYMALRCAGASRLTRAVVVVAAVNLVTHTFFWISFPWLSYSFMLKLYSYEILVALIEGVAYWRFCGFSWIGSLGVSTALNLLSVLAGLVLWHLAFA